MTGCQFSFVPRSIPGAKTPQFLGEECHGVDLRPRPLGRIWAEKINFEYLIDAYRNLNMSAEFFGKNVLTASAETDTVFLFRKEALRVSGD